MWIYEKKLMHPVIISQPDLHLARLLFEPYAGPSSAMTAAISYLNQRFTMPTGVHKALLTDIGTEKHAHLEMIAGMIFQSIQGASLQQMKNAGLSEYFTEHGRSLFPADSGGTAWSAAYCVSSSDAKADVAFDMALEERLRVQFERLISYAQDDGYTEPLEFLKQRAIVHYQRFAEAANLLTDTNE